jgi:flagellar assembly protein FliH
MSKVIPGGQLSGYKAWTAPSVETPGANPVTVETVERIQKQAYDEGYARGHREGLAAAKAKVQRLDKLMAVLSEPFADLDQEVEQQLLLLAKTIARQLVRRELKTDPRQVIAVVREAMAALPVASRAARLHLHPEDAALVREVMAFDEGEQSWQIIDDPVLSRGDCRVTTSTSQVDATLESRLTAIMTAVLGGDREQDDRSPA